MDAYSNHIMAHPSSTNSLDPQQWNPAVLRYREPNDNLTNLASGGLSPSSHVISPEMSPHLHHSDYSPSPPAQERGLIMNGSGPGPSTWETMQQRQQEQQHQQQKQQQQQQRHQLEASRPGNNVSPSEMLESVAIGGDSSGPSSRENQRNSQQLQRQPQLQESQRSHQRHSNSMHEDEVGSGGNRHRPPAEHVGSSNRQRPQMSAGTGYEGVDMDGSRGRSIRQHLETRTRFEDGRLGILPPG
jgi:hypothetical protein